MIEDLFNDMLFQIFWSPPGVWGGAVLKFLSFSCSAAAILSDVVCVLEEEKWLYKTRGVMVLFYWHFCEVCGLWLQWCSFCEACVYFKLMEIIYYTFVILWLKRGRSIVFWEVYSWTGLIWICDVEVLLHLWNVN